MCYNFILLIIIIIIAITVRFLYTLVPCHQVMTLECWWQVMAALIVC